MSALSRRISSGIILVFSAFCFLGLLGGCSDTSDDSPGEPLEDASGPPDARQDSAQDPAASCDDGEKNGDESDVDCGGTCAPCGPGQRCDVPADCVSGECEEGVCAAAGCEIDGCPGEDQACFQGECRPACLAESDCPETAAFECVEGACVDSCAEVSCDPGQYCFAGDCHDACESIHDCLELKAYFICHDGVCQSPCTDVECDAGTTCYRGECYSDCDPNAWEDDCAEGTHCIDEQDICVPRDCSEVNCGMNESCYEGRCIGG